MDHCHLPFASCKQPIPFVSSAVETPFVRARLNGLSTSLEANGVGESAGLSTPHQANRSHDGNV